MAESELDARVLTMAEGLAAALSRWLDGRSAVAVAQVEAARARVVEIEANTQESLARADESHARAATTTRHAERLTPPVDPVQ